VSPLPRIPHHQPALRAAEGVHPRRAAQALAALEARGVHVAAARQEHEVVGPCSAAFGAGVGHGGGWVGLRQGGFNTDVLQNYFFKVELSQPNHLTPND
jgi:hypothetical protein